MAKNPPSPPGPLKILLIEDDPDDIDLFEFALRRSPVNCALNVLEQGDQVVPYLTKATELPDVIVLDLNLPKVSGSEVLKQLKSSDGLDGIPLAILTTSSALEDREHCYRLGADAFLTKPNDLEGFRVMFTTIVQLATRS